jgi:hypothetical protein
VPNSWIDGINSHWKNRQIFSPSVYHGKIIFWHFKIHCNPNNGCPSIKTLSGPVWSKLSTYCIFKFSCEIIFQTVQEYRYENILNSTGNSFIGKYSQRNIFQWFQELGPRDARVAGSIPTQVEKTLYSISWFGSHVKPLVPIYWVGHHATHRFVNQS